MSSVQVEFLPTRFLDRSIDVETRGNGVVYIRNAIPLKPVCAHIPGLLHAQAVQLPDRTWMAERSKATGEWVRLSYSVAARQVDAVTQALLDLEADGRTVMVLSGNSLEHAVLQLAAMQAGMPYSPVTPAYSLLSRDHGKLKSMYALLKPAVVFVQSTHQFEAALRALDLAGVEVVYVEGAAPEGVASVAWSEWVRTPVRTDVDQAIDRLTHDTVAKYLFTSGSTGTPKAVTITQGMMCTALAMGTQMSDNSHETYDRVLLEWLPWSHVAGGTALFNAVLHEGATLYLDNGRPQPGAFDETLRNLQEVAPFRMGTMPIAYAMLLDALERDEALSRRLFSNLRRLITSGARLPDAVYNGIQAHAIRHLGYRIPFTTAYGSTETTAAVSCVYWFTDRADLTGLPHPGVELKLVPIDSTRYEVRVRSATVTPGYLGQPELTANSFDEEGFFRMGDAVTFVDQNDPNEGLVFAGRVAEEFKLLSGVFVRVGSLRVECVTAMAPLVIDAVVTGADRSEVGLMVWLNLLPCRELAGMPNATAAELAASPVLRAALLSSVQSYNRRQTGSSTTVRRLIVLEEPASMDAGEVNDKGYVNQRLVLERRKAIVERLYATPTDPAVVLID